MNANLSKHHAGKELTPNEYTHWRYLLSELPSREINMLYDMTAYKAAIHGNYNGDFLAVVRGFFWCVRNSVRILPGLYGPLVALSALALASLACTLEAPGAAVLDAQNTPTTQAATPTQAQTFLPVRAGETQTVLQLSTATPPHQAARCQVNTTALNVRACPGLDCGAVAWLHAGDIVTITHQARAWLEVNTGNLAGFVKSEFCEVKP